MTAILNQSLLFLIEDSKVDILFAEQRQLHRFLDQSALPFAIGGLPLPSVLNFLDLLGSGHGRIFIKNKNFNYFAYLGRI